MIDNLRRNLEFGDFLIYFYFVVFIRQYLWGLEAWMAWLLTIPISLAAWFAYVSTKESETLRSGKSFWLIVLPPLVLIYLLRVAIPDSSFDVWTLRLFHAERGLRGFLYWPNEFFPTSAPYNPAPDMLTGIFRHVLGYRLGTIINLLVLVWAGQIVNKLLRPHIGNQWVRAVCVLLVLLAEHFLFEINNYMVDLLALPLMLEATWLILNSDSWKNERRALTRVALLLGASVALKLTHLVMVTPLVMVCAWRVMSARPFQPKRLATTSLITFVAFVAPLLPFMSYVFLETGNPVFPSYNQIFHSPFYPLQSGWDGRWGGYGPWEILAWPVVMVLEPGRISELGVYSGRISVGFIVALCGGLLFWRRTRFRTLCFIMLLASLLWSLTMGYIRYALYLEFLSGILVIVFGSLLAEKASSLSVRRVAFLAPLVILLVQSAVACRYTWRTEWSLRPNLFQDFSGHVRESKYLLRDRSIRSLLSEPERDIVDGVDVWIVSGEKTAGLMLLLSRRAPFVNVRTSEYFNTSAGLEKYERTMGHFQGKRMYSFTLASDFGPALFALRYRGLEVGRIFTFYIPFYSPSNRVLVYFFEVKPMSPAIAGKPERTKGEGALPPDDYRAEISLYEPPEAVKPGQQMILFFRVRNTAGSVWSALAKDTGDYRFALRTGWLDETGERRIDTLATSPIFYDLPPGETLTLPVIIKAPSEPGNYILESDMIQEGVGTFKDRGSQSLRLMIRVAPN